MGMHSAHLTERHLDCLLAEPMEMQTVRMKEIGSV